MSVQSCPCSKLNTTSMTRFEVPKGRARVTHLFEVILTVKSKYYARRECISTSISRKVVLICWRWPCKSSFSRNLDVASFTTCRRVIPASSEVGGHLRPSASRVTICWADQRAERRLRSITSGARAKQRKSASYGKSPNATLQPWECIRHHHSHSSTLSSPAVQALKI